MKYMNSSCPDRILIQEVEDDSCDWVHSGYETGTGIPVYTPKHAQVIRHPSNQVDACKHFRIQVNKRCNFIDFFYVLVSALIKRFPIDNLLKVSKNDCIAKK